MENKIKTVFIISNKKHILKYLRKMSEKEVIKMKSFITNKGEKLLYLKYISIFCFGFRWDDNLKKCR